MPVEGALGDPGRLADVVDVHVAVAPPGERVHRRVEQALRRGPPPPPRVQHHGSVPHLRPKGLLLLQAQEVGEDRSDHRQRQPPPFPEGPDQPEPFHVAVVVQEPVGGGPVGRWKEAKLQVVVDRGGGNARPRHQFVHREPFAIKHGGVAQDLPISSRLFE